MSRPVPAVLFHVTKTSNASKIKKRGILPLQTSNWVKSGSGERYGEGEIFAFENVLDAIRWGASWDEKLTGKFGSGKVSIVDFTADLNEWVEDDSDPLGQAMAEGRWLKSWTRVRPEQILRTAPITPERVKEIF